MNNKVISKIVSGTLLCSMVGYTLPVFAYTKDETVYSKLDASGSNYKTIVSTHIENTENEELIKDLSDLLNVKNTSGDETFTQAPYPGRPPADLASGAAHLLGMQIKTTYIIKEKVKKTYQ